jgi:hypothetical protein
MRKVCVMLAATVVLGGMAFATAGAMGPPVTRYSSKVTLAATNPFHGKVTSKKRFCRVGRTVKVFHEPAGLYGKTKTNGEGRWSIPAGKPNGDFYARATRKTKTFHGATTIICRRARSADRHFGS